VSLGYLNYFEGGEFLLRYDIYAKGNEFDLPSRWEEAGMKRLTSGARPGVESRWLACPRRSRLVNPGLGSEYDPLVVGLDAARGKPPVHHHVSLPRRVRAAALPPARQLGRMAVAQGLPPRCADAVFAGEGS
jgi:hypothetical protein